ncbi:MAG: sulfate ABC transporter permease subunit CysT, partial [Gemmataceae bacterium]
MSMTHRRVLPGFGVGLSVTLIYLALMVLIPLGAAVVQTARLSSSEFLAAVGNERALAAYRLTFSAALQAAAINVVLGIAVAWTLVRYEFWGKKWLDALVDVPFALPTAVAGLVYKGLYVEDGWLGQYLVPWGFEAAFSRTGVVLVLVFTGFPFVVRTVQPVLEDLDRDTEKAAESLGASRWQVFRHIIFPVLVPPALTGFTLAFARAIGEYGSVIFISSNMPFQTEIAPVLIVSRLEEYAYREASAIAVVLLATSFLLLLIVNRLERWSQPGGSPRLIRRFWHNWTQYLPTIPFGGDRFAFVSQRLAPILPTIWIGLTRIIIGLLILVPVVNV